MTIALLPRRVRTVRRFARGLAASMPIRRREPQRTVNEGRWVTLPGDYAGPRACPLDTRWPAISTTGRSAPVACANSAAVILHLAGTWSGRVVFEGSSDGVLWHVVTLASLSGDATATETDRPGLWRALPGARLAHLRLHVAALSRGPLRASVAAMPPQEHPAPHSLDPAA